MRHERERAEARQSAERHLKLKQRRNGKVLLIYIASTGILIGANLISILKMQGDMGKLREQINRINSSLVLLQEDFTAPAGADVPPAEDQKGSGSSSRIPKASGGQVLCEGSYGAEWGLDKVDKPKVSSREEVILRLNELGKKNELIDKIYRNNYQYPDKKIGRAHF